MDAAVVLAATLDLVLRRIGSFTCSGTALGTAGWSRTVLGEKGDRGEFSETSRARFPLMADVADARMLAGLFPSPSDRPVNISPRARLVTGLPSFDAAVGRELVSIMSAVKTRGRNPGELYSPNDESAIDPLEAVLSLISPI